MDIQIQILACEMHGDEDISEINNLLGQLSSNAEIVTKEDVLRVGMSTNIHLAVARDIDAPRNRGYRIVGMATLIEKRQLVGFSGFIEDVVVDEAYRSHGVAEHLNLFLIEIAKMLGMQHLELTSNPKRIAAHKLYDKLGYVDRDTRVRRLDLSRK